MIKKYKQFNEGITQYLKGPTKEEIIKNFGDITMDDILIKSVDMDFFPGVKYALDNNANANYMDSYALRKASACDNLDSVKYLIKMGSNINTTSYNSLLKLAVDKSAYFVLKYLLENGANPNDGLYIACVNNKLYAVKLLVKFGADVNFNNGEPLKKAVYFGYYDLVEYLLQHGAIPSKELLSADYSMSLASNKYKLVKELVKSYMNTNEGITQYLKGPTKEEILKYKYDRLGASVDEIRELLNLGQDDEIPLIAEDFLNQYIKPVKIIQKDEYSDMIYLVKKDMVILQYNKQTKELFYNYIIAALIEKIYKEEFQYITILFKDLIVHYGIVDSENGIIANSKYYQPLKNNKRK